MSKIKLSPEVQKIWDRELAKALQELKEYDPFKDWKADGLASIVSPQPEEES